MDCAQGCVGENSDVLQYVNPEDKTQYQLPGLCLIDIGISVCSGLRKVKRKVSCQLLENIGVCEKTTHKRKH